MFPSRRGPLTTAAVSGFYLNDTLLAFSCRFCCPEFSQYVNVVLPPTLCLPFGLFSLEAASCASQKSSQFSACQMMSILMGNFRAFAVPCMGCEPLAVNILRLCKRCVTWVAWVLFNFVRLWYSSFVLSRLHVMGLWGSKERKEWAVLPKLAPPSKLFTKCCEILIGNLRSCGQTVLGGEKKRIESAATCGFELKFLFFVVYFVRKVAQGCFKGKILFL